MVWSTSHRTTVEYKSVQAQQIRLVNFIETFFNVYFGYEI